MKGLEGVENDFHSCLWMMPKNLKAQFLHQAKF